MADELNGIIITGFQKLGLLYRQDACPLMDYPYYLSFLDRAYTTLLSDAASTLPKPSFQRLRGQVQMNAAKFVLACQHLKKPIESQSISGAVCFVTLGCLLDDLIDNGTEKQRQECFEKLNWSYCGAYFETAADPKYVSLTDALMSRTGKIFRMIRQRDPVTFSRMIDELKRTITSEIHVSNGEKSSPFSPLVRDKSILFTYLGFEIALLGNLSERERQLFLTIGNVFRLVDDLCDIEEDAKRGHLNSVSGVTKTEELWNEEDISTAHYHRLLEIYHPTVYTDRKNRRYADRKNRGLKTEIQRGIETGFQELEGNLASLRREISGLFLDFLLYELRVWTLTNPIIRQETLGG